PVGAVANAEERRLGRIDDRLEGVDAVHPEVADREPSALDVGGPQLARLTPTHDVLAPRGDLRERERVGAMDDGDDEAVLDGHGEPDVDGVVLDDGAVVP